MLFKCKALFHLRLAMRNKIPLNRLTLAFLGVLCLHLGAFVDLWESE